MSTTVGYGAKNGPKTNMRASTRDDGEERDEVGAMWGEIETA